MEERLGSFLSLQGDSNSRNVGQFSLLSPLITSLDGAIPKLH